MIVRITVKLDDLRSDIDFVASEADDRERNDLITDVMHRFVPNGDDMTLEVDTDAGTVTVVKEEEELS